MTMKETKKVIEESLATGYPLPFDAMLNCYVAVQRFLAECGNRDIEVQIDMSEVI